VLREVLDPGNELVVDRRGTKRDVGVPGMTDHDGVARPRCELDLFDVGSFKVDRAARASEVHLRLHSSASPFASYARSPIHEMIVSSTAAGSSSGGKWPLLSNSAKVCRGSLYRCLSQSGYGEP
jgi:hypothetical protein